MLRHVWVVRAAILLGVILILGIFGFGISVLSENLGIGNIFVLAYNFITSPTDKLAQVNGRTNILLLGKAGGARSEDSPDLTDTIIVVSVGLSKNNIKVVSIPRDLWIPELQSKINSAYYYGKKPTAYFTNTGGGISFAKAITSEVVGEPIQYGVVVDFSSFKDIVDSLGGVQVDVANSFTDKLYPIEGRENDTCGGDVTFACRYETVSFNSGVQKMNGDTALIFVRSRHAEGDEGTDLAREARQQKVVDAIKDKLVKPSTFLNPKTDLGLLSVVKKYVETDIDPATAAILARTVVKNYKNLNQYLIPDNLIFNPPINKNFEGQYVFIPALGDGNWGDINKWFTSILGN